MDLFGNAAERNKGKANPYADKPGSASAAAPASAAASPPRGPSSAAESAEDAARSQLLAGGRKAPAPAALVQPSPLPGAGADEGPPLGSMVETDFEFDFADLNITSAAVGDAARAGVGGAALGAADGSLDFAAIDSDMARFEKDELVRDALNRGVDLRVYSKQVDGELRQLEMLSIADYVKESDSIAALFEQIQGCESVLNQMQGLLQGFQENLGGISDEIRSLQEESLQLSIKMQNRKNVGAKVKSFLAKVAVPEALISRILEAEINEAWMRDLRTLSEKIEFLNGTFRSSSKTATAAAAAQVSAGNDDAATGAFTDSLQDLKVNPLDTPAATQSVPVIRNLQAKAVARVREFLARAIGEVCKPKTNMQKQQEYVLLKYSYAMAFLTEHGVDRERGNDAGREIRMLYSREVGSWYGDIFKRYAEELGKALLPWASKGDVLANFDASQLGAFAASAAAASPSGGAGAGGTGAGAGGPAPRPADPFSIVDRLPLLAELATAAVLQPHVLQAERTRLPLETLFRSLLRHLADVAMAEEAFCRKFFGDREGREVLNQVLAKAFAAAVAFLEEHLPHSWDAPGVLLVVALVSSQWVAAGQRGSACLDGFCLRAVEVARKRFRSIFDANVASLKAAAGAPRKTFGAYDTQPHALTRRYAEWSASVLVLHRTVQQPSAADQMLLAHMASVAREVEGLWAKMAAELTPGGTATGKAAGPGASAGTGGGGLARAAFLLNQHATLVRVYTERGVAAEDAQAAVQAHARVLSNYVDEAVDSLHFKVFAGWVRKAEAAALAAHRARGGAAAVSFVPQVLPTGVPAYLPDGLPSPGSLEPTEAETVVRDFALNWRSGLSSLNDDVQRFFAAGAGAGGSPGGAAGAAAASAAAQKESMAALVAVFSRVAELHQRFSHIAARAFPAGPAFVRDFVALQTVYAEARRYGQR